MFQRSQIVEKKVSRVLGDAAHRARLAGSDGIMVPTAQRPKPRPEFKDSKRVTCREAVSVSAAVGARIFWRPDGIEDIKDPGADTALVLEG